MPLIPPVLATSPVFQVLVSPFGPRDREEYDPVFSPAIAPPAEHIVVILYLIKFTASL